MLMKTRHFTIRSLSRASCARKVLLTGIATFFLTSVLIKLDTHFVQQLKNGKWLKSGQSETRELISARQLCSQLSNDLALPNICTYMPHLMNKTREDVAPVYSSTRQKGERRQNVFTVIGIPTVRRTKTNYLMSTLESILENLSPLDAKDVLIVVMITAFDSADYDWARNKTAEIRAKYSQLIDSGLLEIMMPPVAWYPPDLNQLTPTFNDPPARMFWRTKQNLDYAYLMLYCQNRGSYYLQLEDDIVTKPNFLAQMRDFLKQQNDNKNTAAWLMLEFSTLGFIGKFFRASHLSQLAQFILMLHRKKPVDWILDLDFAARYCSPGGDWKSCAKEINAKYRRLMKPSLFQHKGRDSSLPGKVQKAIDKNFDDGKNRKGLAPKGQGMSPPHTHNPSAAVGTSLKLYHQFTLQNAYLGTTIFWALNPQIDDWIRFDFHPPIQIDEFTFRTGNAEHPNDKLYNAIVQIRYLKEEKFNINDRKSHNNNNTNKSDNNEDYETVTEFTSAGMARAKLHTTSTSQKWILSELLSMGTVKIG